MIRRLPDSLAPAWLVREHGLNPTSSAPPGPGGTPTGPPPAITRIYQVISEGRAPQRADRAVAGTMPTRAHRYCEAMTSASAFGWYIYFSLCASAFLATEEWTSCGRTTAPKAGFHLARLNFPDLESNSTDLSHLTWRVSRHHCSPA